MAAELSMNVVSKRAGLSQHVIRVWERRYGAIKPRRNEAGWRLYTEDDVRRLSCLKRLTHAGHSIGSIAKLETPALEALWQREAGSSDAAPLPQTPEDQFLTQALLAVHQMDRPALKDCLRASAVAFGSHASLERVVGPLAEKIGDLWRTGEINAAHEHFAAVVIREYLWANTRPFAPAKNAPTLIVTTPPGQLHELGAIMVAAAASDVGWNIVYLGPSLPPAEIANAARHNGARAVGLSIVYPGDDARLPQELESLRTHLAPEVAVIAGGRAASAYAAALKKIGAFTPATLKELYDQLDRLRTTNYRSDHEL